MRRAAWFYAHVQFYCHAYLRCNVRGLGFFLRNIRANLVIDVHGSEMYFDSTIGGSYGCLIGGMWTEPETHLLLDRVLEATPNVRCFIDVGANIGEMILDIAARRKAVKVIGFEPIQECANAIEQSVALNHWENVDIRMKAVGESIGTGLIAIDRRSPNASALAGVGVQCGVPVEISTLDVEIGDVEGEAILLIDVEGSELSVVRGGREFIHRRRPLIIFEYNHISRKHFTLDQMRSELGSDYTILRLRRDGFLDENLQETWNCVGAHMETSFFGICNALRRLDV